MMLLVYSETTAASLESRLGLPEHSYYFLLKAFLPALQKLGEVRVIEQPLTQADAIYDDCQARGIACCLLSFSAPQNTTLGLRCPTIPVFAWEFDRVPHEVWDDDPRQDWAYVFARVAGAISCSRFGVEAVERTLGPQPHLAAITAPIYDRYAHLGQARQGINRFTLSFRGSSYDSAADDLQAFADRLLPAPPPPAPPAAELEAPPVAVAQARGVAWRLRRTAAYAAAWYREVVRELLPSPLANALTQLLARWRQARVAVLAAPVDPLPALPPVPPPTTPAPVRAAPSLRSIELQGVIYTAVFNPYDGRKNWTDILSAFCLALQDEEQATLLLKFTHHDPQVGWPELISYLRRLPARRCRVVALHGYLDQDSFEQLISASSYIVNDSVGEGLCLPLAEFMAAGCPALAPAHTAMSEYMSAATGFVLHGSPEPFVFPHDPRFMIRTQRYRMDWAQLAQAFRDSFQLATQDPQAYAQMSQAARSSLCAYSSDAVVDAALRAFLQRVLPQVAP